MLNSFIAFHVNGINYFIYMITNSFWMFLLILSVAGSMILLLKEQVDTSVRDEQNII